MRLGHGVGVALRRLSRACWRSLRSAARCPRRAASKSAVLVIDANTGRVLHQSAADEPRHPASLAKMMTIYLAFELHRAGPAQLPDQDQVLRQRRGGGPLQARSRARARRSPLIDAIKVLITKSANDVAIALAEHIAGSEENFARLMTAEGAPARHVRHHLPQCLGPARRRAGDDRAGHGDPGAAAAGRFSQALSAVCHPHLHLQGRDVPQPQHPALPLRGHRRPEDRLHARLRLQPGGLRAARQEACDRRGVRRRQRRRRATPPCAPSSTWAWSRPPARRRASRRRR